MRWYAICKGFVDDWRVAEYLIFLEFYHLIIWIYLSRKNLETQWIVLDLRFIDALITNLLAEQTLLGVLSSKNFAHNEATRALLFILIDLKFWPKTVSCRRFLSASISL